MQSDIKLLLVDDHAMAPLLSRNALAPLTKVAVVGDAAVFQVVEWEGGDSEINFEAMTRHETTTLSTWGPRMEGLRLVDEARLDPGGKSEREDVLLDS